MLNRSEERRPTPPRYHCNNRADHWQRNAQNRCLLEWSLVCTQGRSQKTGVSSRKRPTSFAQPFSSLRSDAVKLGSENIRALRLITKEWQQHSGTYSTERRCNRSTRSARDRTQLHLSSRPRALTAASIPLAVTCGICVTTQHDYSAGNDNIDHRQKLYTSLRCSMLHVSGGSTFSPCSSSFESSFAVRGAVRSLVVPGHTHSHGKNQSNDW